MVNYQFYLTILIETVIESFENNGLVFSIIRDNKGMRLPHYKKSIFIITTNIYVVLITCQALFWEPYINCIILFNSLLSSELLSPFYGWNWGTEQLNDLRKATQPVSDFKSRTYGASSLCCNLLCYIATHRWEMNQEMGLPCVWHVA